MSFADRYDLALFDLDGVVYLGPQAVTGAPEAISQLREHGVQIGFVTNNAARSPEAVAAHLTELGVTATADEVISSAPVTVGLMAERFPAGSKVLVVGTDNLAEQLTAVGLTPVRSAEDAPVAVVQGYNNDLDWRSLDEAALAIAAGAVWYATNGDLTRPTERGLVPGNGAAVAALAAAVEPDPIVIGKPHPPLLLAALERFGTEPSRAVFVGDRLDTDIQGAVATGMDSLLVFTGTHGKQDLLTAAADRRPSLIGAGIATLLSEYQVTVEVDRAKVGAASADINGSELRWSADLDSEDGQYDLLRAALPLAWAAADRGHMVDPAPLAAALDKLR